VEVDIAAALAVSATQAQAQGTSHADDWLGLPKEEASADLRAQIQAQEAITKSYEIRGGASREPRYLKIDARQLESGAYRLMLRVTDLLAGRSVSKTKEFRIVE